jgi:quercetin dioxygenase-like cupin family protein
VPVIRFDDAPRAENVQGRHVRHGARKLGSAEILMSRTTKDPGPCDPYIHKHDHEDVIVMLRGSFTRRLADEDVTLREGDTLIIPRGTEIHRANDEFTIVSLVGRPTTVSSNALPPPWVTSASSGLNPSTLFCLPM